MPRAASWASLSQRLVRLALLASAVSLLSYAGPASAQLPVFQAAPEPAPAEPVVPAESPPAESPPAAIAPGEALPVAAAPPPGAAPPTPGAGTAPAKADVITDPNARHAAEARVDRAADDDADAADDSERRRWYGWQTLVADGASFASLLVSASLNGKSSTKSDIADTLTWSGLLGYEFAPGIIHFAHRNTGRGFASFGLRLGMPLAGAFVGASLASGCNTNLCEANGAGIGVLLGMAGAIAIDAAVFAYDDPKRSSSRKLGLLPVVSITPQQAWIGLAGRL